MVPWVHRELLAVLLELVDLVLMLRSRMQTAAARLAGTLRAALAGRGPGRLSFLAALVLPGPVLALAPLAPMQRHFLRLELVARLVVVALTATGRRKQAVAAGEQPPTACRALEALLTAPTLARGAVVLLAGRRKTSPHQAAATGATTVLRAVLEPPPAPVAGAAGATQRAVAALMAWSAFSTDRHETVDYSGGSRQRGNAVQFFHAPHYQPEVFWAAHPSLSGRKQQAPHSLFDGA